MALQESGEMYLETIYVLSQESSQVRAIDVGEYMGYSKPSVSRALGLLRDEGLLKKDDNGFIKLTEAGKNDFTQAEDEILKGAAQSKYEELWQILYQRINPGHKLWIQFNHG